MLQIKRHSQITFLWSETLASVSGVVHAFSTRRGERADFTLGPDSNPLVQMNRDRFFAAIGAAGWPLLKLSQVHSAKVVVMKNHSPATEALEGDALVTGIQGLALAVQTADCVPILIADRESRAVAAIHAGWRGTASRITENTVAAICDEFRIDPGSLVAVVGPHIGVCCYEVGGEVIDSIGEPAAFEHRPEWNKPHLNLAEANRRQLISFGIREEHIEISTLCTSCRGDLLFSYRRDGSRAGRMLAVIGLNP
jgi:polyphenol oxidase